MPRAIHGIWGHVVMHNAQRQRVSTILVQQGHSGLLADAELWLCSAPSQSHGVVTGESQLAPSGGGSHGGCNHSSIAVAFSPSQYGCVVPSHPILSFLEVS